MSVGLAPVTETLKAAAVNARMARRGDGKDLINRIDRVAMGQRGVFRTPAVRRRAAGGGGSGRNRYGNRRGCRPGYDAVRRCVRGFC
jgi:hypothetical protein